MSTATYPKAKREILEESPKTTQPVKRKGAPPKPRRRTKRKKQPEATRRRRTRRIVKTAGFNLTAVGLHLIIPPRVAEQIHVPFIAFTVDGEVDITLYDGVIPFSGPMSFGGTDEPRGAVMHLGTSPIVCSPNSGFAIHVSTANRVAGYCTYYYLPAPIE